MYEQHENPWNNQEQPTPQPRPTQNLMATAALICAIIGIISVCCMGGAIIFGGLAIVFGLLSRGSQKKAVRPAKTAIWIGIIVIIVSAIITIACFGALIHEFGSLENLFDVYMNTFEEMYGIDPETLMDPAMDFDAGSNFL